MFLLQDWGYVGEVMTVSWNCLGVAGIRALYRGWGM